MASEQVLIGLASIATLGFLAQWAAWRLGIPSILLLLLTGLVAGPITGFLHPNELFGTMLVPLVSLSVAVILFEGGLSLRLRELRSVGQVFGRLATVGVLITWLVSTAAARGLLGMDLGLAALLGSILVVTGPTVIGPLLRHIRPSGPAASILKWEGIVIDPVGAILGVLVLRAVLAGETTDAPVEFLKTFVVGLLLGLAGAGFLIIPLRRYAIPDWLHNAASLAAVASVFTLGELLESESGLLGVTLMGIILANQRGVVIKHIVAFKENLRTLLISALFIVLAARLKVDDLVGLGWESLLFVVVLIVVARPAAVLAAALGSNLDRRQRIFLAWMAPRGIVAASVSSVFALRLQQANYPGADRLVPLTFLVIIGTVAFYGLTAAAVARRLGLSQPNPQGILLVGAHDWARELGKVLKEQGCSVLLADTNWTNLAAARMKGLGVYYGSVHSEHALDELDLSEMGRLVAITSNDEVNSLACLRFVELFDRREVYQLSPGESAEGRREAVAAEQRGRFLFGKDLSFHKLTESFEAGATIKATKLTPEFDLTAFQKANPAGVPLVLIKDKGHVEMATLDRPLGPKPGHTLIWLAAPAG